MTFSIVAFDVTTGELGVAVQSRVIAVGAVVPWAKAGVGAVASQALSNRTYGPRALALMRDGVAPDEIVERLVADDDGAGIRQVGIVDAFGRSAAHTGLECPDWAGSSIGEGFAVQGNTLTGPSVIEAMAQSFRSSIGSLAERLLGALAGGQREGGDRRGMQSAAVLVVKQAMGYGGFDDRYIDLRVDEHSEPIAELMRIQRIYKPEFRGRPPRFRKLDASTVREIQEIATRLGAYSEEPTGRLDDQTIAALRTLLRREGVEDRWRDSHIDEVALGVLRTRLPIHRPGD